jgi:hypothetical protein
MGEYTVPHRFLTVALNFAFKVFDITFEKHPRELVKSFQLKVLSLIMMWFCWFS